MTVRAVHQGDRSVRALTVVSHPAVLAVNQAPYRELARLGWRVTVVVPATWRSDLNHEIIRPTPLDGLGCDLEVVPIYRPGSIILHAYHHRALRSALVRSRAHVVYVEEVDVY